MLPPWRTRNEAASFFTISPCSASEIGGMHGGIAPIVDEDADQQSVRLAVRNVKSEIAADGGEATRLNDVGKNIGAHLRAPIAQFAQAAGRHIGRDRRDQQRDDGRRGEEWPKQSPGRYPGRVHHDDFGIRTKLIEDMRRGHHQRDGRDHHHQQRHDHSGNADENEERLPLARDQVEIAHRLGEPDHHCQTDQGDQERSHGGAKHVPADRPHWTEHPPAGPMASRRLRRRSGSRQPISPEDNHFHAFTKWPRQGKAIEHAH